MKTYNNQFYQEELAGSPSSARTIVPVIMDLIRPSSVLDVGCGLGTWLKVFMDSGLQDVFGADQDVADRAGLCIPADKFLPCDLKKPLDLKRKFDMTVSLEVAEHIPPECAEMFVDTLTRHAPVVLFSAAIPHQAGCLHLNEQWPDYWINLFEKRGYSVYDCLRKRFWNDPAVEYWYAQNMFIFARNDHEKLPELKMAARDSLPLRVVHPRLYAQVCNPRNYSLRQVLGVLPVLFKQAVMQRISNGRARAQ